MNYKLLLKKYMNFIGAMEGTDYTDGLNPDAEINWNELEDAEINWNELENEDLSKEEMLELIRMGDESFTTLKNEK